MFVLMLFTNSMWSKFTTIEVASYNGKSRERWCKAPEDKELVTTCESPAYFSRVHGDRQAGQTHFPRRLDAPT
jgi:hypothetical protein